MKTLVKSIIVILFSASFFSCNKGGSTDIDLKLIPVQSGKYWGYVDRQGQYIINPQFSFTQPFSDGLALVQATDDKFGYIDMEGKYIIQPSLKKGTDFVAGHALVEKENSKIEIINSKGETIVTLAEAIEEAYKFSEGLSRVWMGTKYGFINSEGKIVISPNYNDAGDFKEGLAFVRDDKGTERNSWDSRKPNRYGYINKKGELVIDYQFETALNFSEGLAPISQGNKWGFIGTDGKIKINPQFDYVSQFSNGIATFWQGKLWGYINKSGEIVINPQFKQVDLFYGNYLAPAQMADGEYGYIDMNGKYVINPQFEKASRFFGDIAFITDDDKYGIIDKKGKIIVNPQFDMVLTFSVEKLQMVENNYFNINTLIGYLTKLITENSVDSMTFDTPVAEVVEKYTMGKENFNDYKNRLNRFGLTLTDKENVSNYAFLKFGIQVDNYETYGTNERTASIAEFNFTIDLKSGWSSKSNEILPALKTAFSGYQLTYDDTMSNFLILSNDIQDIHIKTLSSSMISISILKSIPYEN